LKCEEEEEEEKEEEKEEDNSFLRNVGKDELSDTVLHPM